MVNPPPDRIITPWQAWQVDALNWWQHKPGSEPFLCGRDHGYVNASPLLIAYPDGWRCSEEGCGYELEWAYAYMAMTDHMINWHVSCPTCANLLDSCYEETLRAERAEAEVWRLNAALKHMKEAIDRVYSDVEGASKRD